MPSQAAILMNMDKTFIIQVYGLWGDNNKSFNFFFFIELRTLLWLLQLLP